MVDITGAVSSVIPNKQAIISGSASMFFWVTILIVIFLLMLIGGIIVFVIIRARQFNKKIEIYEDRNGYMEYVGNDRAKELVYNSYGDSCFYLKKRKKYLPRGEIKVGKNRFLYAIAQDGELVNVGLESIDRKLNVMNVKPIHPDMRGFKSGMVKIIRDRYEKKSMWKELAPIIIPIILFIIVGLVMYFMANELVKFLDKLPAVIDSQSKINDNQLKILSAMNNLCGGSGITPA